MTKNNLIVLETYEGRAAVDVKWLENEIAPQTLEDFMNGYTWDEGEYLVEKYHDEQFAY